MIVSRAAELARLDALLTALTRGEGGALVLHGEAGIGKTTLLDTLAERCDGAVTVVRACGAETEAELAFSALADLLEPVLDDDFDAAFAGALAFDDRRPMPFERARTQLAFGRRLHRACRRAAARQQLRAALEGFERLHADAWASQAEAELRAAGGRHRPPQDDRALTPQELRVAAAVQRGASNRDIAADLFLSPKTVEFHLRQIFRKLDVRSRTQLVAALADNDTAS